MPVNHEITFLMQEVFNLLPNLNVEELVRAFSVKTNDMMLVIYISSLVRSVVALHNLINNKLTLKEAELESDKDKVTASEDWNHASCLCCSATNYRCRLFVRLVPRPLACAKWALAL
mmetsp:Transcript_19200/g.48543  ORF Transcript_19200/g.48543 Transcript_19200/m.48543 type:complete len:117 (-) Transcript_19200:232-582(-)